MDHRTHERLEKAVFLVFFQGDQLKARVEKICEGFHAKIYHCPERPNGKEETMFPTRLLP